MKIEVLYPELCNLYGDLANAKYLARSSGAEFVMTKLGEPPAFLSEDVALVCIGGTTERGQEIVRDALRPYLSGFEDRTEAGGITLATGNALEIFGEYIARDDGSRIEMLGMFPTHAQRKMMQRHNSLYLGTFGGQKIVGFKSQFSHSWGDNGDGLFTTLRGVGLNPDTMAEGIRKNNFLLTYLLGPLVILNPDFAKYLLTLMGVREPELAFEEAAYDVYRTRLTEFEDPDRGFVY